jgi:hypothetical protein
MRLEINYIRFRLGLKVFVFLIIRNILQTYKPDLAIKRKNRPVKTSEDN